MVDSEHAFWPLDTLDRFVEEGLSFVVEEADNTQLVGFLLAAYQPVTRKLTWENMYLSPGYRRRALADACFYQSWSIAQQRGAIMAEGIVNVTNDASQKMLQRLGFQTAGTYSWMLKFSL
ncbi:MAG: GNAT family N-acetyltransferase [Candidatus Woesearchaeota archaeon]|nr:GNAT family N-acetyltransferase [Candidatus Woesearchaeota archaeon]